MEMENIVGKMAVIMKDNGALIKFQEMVFTSGQMGDLIKVIVI